MGTTPATWLRGLLKLLAVAVGAAAIGTGIGVGLSRLTGDDGGAGPLVPPRGPSTPTVKAQATATTGSTAPAPTATTTGASAAATPSQTASPQDGATVARVKILSATLFPAATAGGRARGRARVAVRVRVTNRDKRTLTPPNPLLLSAGDRIGVDSHAAALADPVIQPLAPGSSVTGELRFEIEGAVTRRLNARPRAELAIANRVITVRMTISPTPALPA